MAIREQPKHGLSRHAVAVGDVVGFLDRDQQQRSGRILRLNDKTITLQIGAQLWCVAYALLHRVVESSADDGDLPELGILEDRCQPATLLSVPVRARSKVKCDP